MTERSRYDHLKDQLTQLLSAMDVRSGNYHEGFLLADTTETNVGKVPAKANTIFVSS